MNEGEWPRDDAGSGFLREEEIETLNQRIRLLNKRAVQQGAQGEGHWAVREGHAVCLGPLEQRRLSQRQFAGILESAECAIALTASFSQEEQPDRIWNVSEFFSRLYFEVQDSALSEGISKALLAETRRWLAETDLFPEKPPGEIAGQTRIAYNARRQTEQPFGEYEFALSEEMAWQPVLNVTQWESVMKAPALVWLEIFLGVKASAEDGDAWAAATGRWVHDWLAGIASEQLSAIPTPLEITRRVRDGALRFRARTEALCAASEKVLPDWWISGWRNALYLVDELAAKIAAVEGWERIATEFPLPSRFAISLGASKRLRLGGRIDLLLGRRSTNDNSLGSDEIWVIDYKTGKKKKLVSSRWDTNEKREKGVRARLLAGDAVQLGLYALGVRELGVKKIHASLVSLSSTVAKPELELSDVEAVTDIWLELQRMQQTGIFGMRGFIRSPWSFQNDYPLATLEIDSDRLDEKWTKTHPPLAMPEEDEW